MPKIRDLLRKKVTHLNTNKSTGVSTVSVQMLRSERMALVAVVD